MVTIPLIRCHVTRDLNQIKEDVIGEEYSRWVEHMPECQEETVCLKSLRKSESKQRLMQRRALTHPEFYRVLSGTCMGEQTTEGKQGGCLRIHGNASLSN